MVGESLEERIERFNGYCRALRLFRLRGGWYSNSLGSVDIALELDLVRKGKRCFSKPLEYNNPLSLLKFLVAVGNYGRILGEFEEDPAAPDLFLSTSQEIAKIFSEAPDAEEALSCLGSINERLEQEVRKSWNAAISCRSQYLSQNKDMGATILKIDSYIGLRLCEMHLMLRLGNSINPTLEVLKSFISELESDMFKSSKEFGTFFTYELRSLTEKHIFDFLVEHRLFGETEEIIDRLYESAYESEFEEERNEIKIDVYTSWMLAAQGRLTEAIDKIEKLSAKFPDVAFFYEKIRILYTYGGTEMAREEVRKLEYLSPLAAKACFECGDLEESVRIIDSIGDLPEEPQEDFNDRLSRENYTKFAETIKGKYLLSLLKDPNKNPDELVSELFENKWLPFEEVFIGIVKAGIDPEALEIMALDVPEYRVVRKLKSGGWSDLYLIIEEGESDEDFMKVLKVPADNLPDNDPNMERFIAGFGSVRKALKELTKEERRINSKTSSTSRDRFKHFHYRPIPQFFDMKYVGGEDKGVPALVYEYIHGCTFDEFFSVGRSVGEVVDVFARGAYALNYIHSKGFVHNDLKGDNMMVGENGNVYVLDLAFSRFEDSGSSIRGVRAFTAPERVLGGVSSSELADQYGFGVMMYKALVGMLPVGYDDVGGDKEEFARRVHEGGLRPDFDALRRKVRPELAVIVEKCLAFRPEDRYGSMQEVEDELVRVSTN